VKKERTGAGEEAKTEKLARTENIDFLSSQRCARSKRRKLCASERRLRKLKRQKVRVGQIAIGAVRSSIRVVDAHELEEKKNAPYRSVPVDRGNRGGTQKRAKRAEGSQRLNSRYVNMAHRAGANGRDRKVAGLAREKVGGGGKQKESRHRSQIFFFRQTPSKKGEDAGINCVM